MMKDSVPDDIAPLVFGFQAELATQLNITSTPRHEGLTFWAYGQTYQLSFMPWGIHLLQIESKGDWIFDYEYPDLIEQIIRRIRIEFQNSNPSSR